jgi:hypothetical protein
LAGQVITGTSVSFTVTVNEQLADPDVEVTVVVPIGKNDPEAGVVVTAPQPPDAVVAPNVTLAPQLPGVLLTVILAGQVSVQPATKLKVTVLSVEVDAALFTPVAAEVATAAGIVAITVPLPVIPDTVTVYVGPVPLTMAVVAPAVPLRVTSPVANPFTASLNVAVKSIGEVDVGSACAAAWLIVTVGTGILKVTVLSVEVEEALGKDVAVEVATPEAIVAITVPLDVMPETVMVYVGPVPLTIAVVAPAVPLRVTSPVANPVTGSLNTAVNKIGLVDVGSVCAAAWLIVTVGAVGAL